MSSPPRGSGLDGDDALDTQSDSSYLGSETSQHRESSVCRWRTTEFHDQECSRFFDCPSHQVERRLSIDGNDAESNDDTEAVSRGLSILNVSTEQHDGTSVGPAERSHDPRLDAPLPPPPSASTAPASTSPHDEPQSGASLAEASTRQLPHSPNNGRTEASDDSVDNRPEPPADSTETPDWSREPHGSELPHAASAPPEHPRNEGSYFTTQSREESYPSSPVGQTIHQGPPSLGPESRRASEFILPRWQPDAEVTYCPICHSQFNIFVRKHHCRKCGRVVCNACSPHRIIIPHQYIVRPPGSEIPLPQSLLIDGLGGGYFDVNGLSGGERVRLCNPCVPDPNIAPPHSPVPPQVPSPRSAHYRSRSSLSSAYGPVPSSNRYSAVIPPSSGYEHYRYYSPRTRSITMAGGPSRQPRNDAYPSTFDRIMAGGSSTSASTSYPTRVNSLGSDAASSRQRMLPPTPQIAEEDECPICHRELPSRSLPNFEAAREAHINTCIQTHSAYGSPRGEAGEGMPVPPPRRTGMYAYSATEKDCIDDAECTICLEEFTPKVRMARLECLCRFHYSCISAWFVNHPGRCPVHQHDGFGY